jgi:hypothetical protein
MSHIARYSSVAEIVAKQYEGGRVLPYYLIYSRQRRTTSTNLAIYTKALHRGVGLSVDQATTALVFVGDPYGAQQEWTDLINQVQQTYIGMLAMIAYQQIGLNAEILEGEEGTLIIKGSEATNVA